MGKIIKEKAFILFIFVVLHFHIRRLAFFYWSFSIKHFFYCHLALFLKVMLDTLFLGQSKLDHKLISDFFS